MTNPKADPLREALAIARKRIEYLGSFGNERHQKANEDKFFPMIDAALVSQAAAAPTMDELQTRIFDISCHKQFELATRLAVNLGYVLVGEPEHPDSPHAKPPAPVCDGGEAVPDRDGMDGTGRLCRALYRRTASAKDYLGGSDARMLHDAADAILAVTPGERGSDSADDLVARLEDHALFTRSQRCAMFEEAAEAIAGYRSEIGLLKATPPVVAGADRAAVIEECARAAIDVTMPRYGTNARFTGRAEMQGWIVKAIRALVDAGKAGEGKP